jgi:hypothetical protein
MQIVLSFLAFLEKDPRAEAGGLALSVLIRNVLAMLASDSIFACFPRAPLPRGGTKATYTVLL